MSYYTEKLGGARLRKCYDTAPIRVKQYLNAEIYFLMERIKPLSSVLELGCGYGRVMLELGKIAGRIVGIDTSKESLALAHELLGSSSKYEIYKMDALELEFADDEFDTVVCAQNGICAFNVDQAKLVNEAIRVTKSGGKVYFSSYTERFFPERLGWFKKQSELGLIGEIDYDSTGDGIIACKDGFRASAMSPKDFLELCKQLNIEGTVTEVDDSSVICEVVVPETA